MDSLSQLALGAAVGIAVMGRRTAVWKAALWGGIAGTLPDLDAFIDHGDAIADMTLHRANSHALFWLTLAAPAIAWIVNRVHGTTGLYRRWWLAVWLALITHPLLDLMTVYGTQIARPFTNEPYGVGSVFIIDPLYTLPLLVGVGVALRAAPARGLRWNAAGLALSTAYLAWGVIAQQQVTAVARESLRAQGIEVRALLVTPAPFNSVLWRVLAITPQGYVEGYRSLLDDDRSIAFDRFDRGDALLATHGQRAAVQRIAGFSHGFFSLAERDGRLLLTDLRMGQEPSYFFRFVIAERRGGDWVDVPATTVGMRPDVQRTLPWLWQRLLGRPLPPPR